MDSYVKVCHRPITIGIQKFVYQCEPIVFSAAHGETIIRGFIPSNKGKELYPSQEADRIKHYELKIRSFTGDVIELHFTKVFKDKSQEEYLTTVSFSDMVNRLFAGNPANIWKHNAPEKSFQ